MERWDTITPPVSMGFLPDSPLLLTDGSVMVAHLATDGMRWYRLAPDPVQGYVLASWAPVASTHTPRYGQIAVVVLASGRVFVTGGSAPSRAATAGEVYDPATDTWSPVEGFRYGWDDDTHDICATLLPDGTVLCAAVTSTAAVIYNPAAGPTGGWAPTPSHVNFEDAATMTLTYHGHALVTYLGGVARYYPGASASWVGIVPPPFTPPSDATAPRTPGPLLQLMDVSSGPAALEPGTVIAFGSAAEYAYLLRDGRWLYQRGLPPRDDGTPRETAGRPAILMPSGRILVLADDDFYTVDPTVASPDAVHPVTSPATTAATPAFSATNAHLLLLPTGQVFAFSAGRVDLYTPDSGDPAPRDVWRPVLATIDGVAASASGPLLMGHAHALGGQTLTGWSNAVNQASTESIATNYPIVRLRQTDAGTGTTNTFYCHSYDHRGPEGTTLVGVADYAATTTTFDLPAPTGGSGLGIGPAELTVIVNGIESLPVPVELTYNYRLPPGPRLWNVLVGSLADGPLYVLGPDHVFHPVPPGPNDGGRTNAALPAIRRAVGAFAELGQLGALVEADQMELAQANALSGSAQDTALKPGQIRNARTSQILAALVTLIALVVVAVIVIGVTALSGGILLTSAIVGASGLVIGLGVNGVTTRATNARKAR